MELAEVKKYFENADLCLANFGHEFRMTKKNFKSIHQDENEFYVDNGQFQIYSEERGFAKILTTKEPSFSITKDQLRQLTDPKVSKVNLEVGKWYKRIWKDGSRDIDLFLISDLIDNKFFMGEFFRNNERLEEGVGSRFGNKKDERYFEIEATNEEVFNALKNEAVRRGFVEGAHITPMFSNGKDYYQDENIISRPLNFKLKGNIFVVDGGVDVYRIFVNGKWATRVKTITKSEAEKLLNKKIID